MDVIPSEVEMKERFVVKEGQLLHQLLLVGFLTRKEREIQTKINFESYNSNTMLAI